MRTLFAVIAMFFCAICEPISASPIQVPLKPSEFKKRGVTLTFEEHAKGMIHVTVTWSPKEPSEEGSRLDLLIWKARAIKDPIGDRVYQGINEPDKKGNHSMVFMIAKESLPRSELVFRENQNVNYRLRLDELTKSDDPFSK